jgi:hypothetical protein
MSSLPVALLALVAGCASTTSVHLPLGPDERAEIQASLGDRRVTVEFRTQKVSPTVDLVASHAAHRVLRGNAQLAGNHLQVDAPDESVTIPLDHLESINTNHAVGGAVEGGLLGFLTGLVVGGVVGYATGRDCGPHDNRDLCFGRGANAFFLGLGLANIGAPMGVVIGGLHGRGTFWKFE